MTKRPAADTIPQPPKERRAKQAGKARQQGDSFEAAFHLVLVNPPCPEQYRDHPLTEGHVLIGRDHACTLVLRQDDLSRKHARLTREQSKWVIEDLESTNGTYVEGTRVTRCELSPGARFSLAHNEFVLLERDDPVLARYRRYFNEKRQDPLTELPNEDALQEALLDATTSGQLALVLLEISDFQRLNVQLGREQGDQIIKEVADKLRLRVRDPIYRQRGARFALIRDHGSEIEHEIQRLVESTLRAVMATGIETPFRICAGGAVGEMQEAHRLLEVAERALVQARRTAGVWIERVDVAERHSIPKFIDLTTSVEIENPVSYVRLRAHMLSTSLKVGQTLFAVEVAERQVIAMANERLFHKLERALDRAVRDAVLASGDASAITVGDGLDGHPVFVALGASTAGRAAKLAAEIENRFATICRETELDGRLIISRPVLVSEPRSALVEATRALTTHQAGRPVTLPLPIGLALRGVDDAVSNEQRFFALTRLHQAITRWLFVVFASELLRNHKPEEQSLSPRLEDALAKPVTEGAWVQLTKMYAQALAKSRERVVIPVFVEMVAGADDVLGELERFVTVRNRFSHGHDVRAKEFCDDWGPRIRGLLTGPLVHLGDYAVRYVERVDAIDEDVFDIHFRSLAGDNLVAERMVDRRSKAIPAGRIVIDGREGSLLALSPFAIHCRCPTCHVDEVFFLDRLAPQAVFRSLRKGAHEIKRLSDAGIDRRFADTIMAALNKALVVL